MTKHTFWKNIVQSVSRVKLYRKEQQSLAEPLNELRFIRRLEPYNMCDIAALNGSLEVLKWVRENGCPCRESMVSYAASSGGHLAVLKWVRENGC
eukprot:CAMPEP_0119006852 /NCGR_PEP_ID=MMETSP1176-20130426/2590_1 /TAXON_ID=265551 /ORGANISM="Synedropsis recta cf, Strain CCMP1620" /LENGTH=94 /DNA_ID=CAMNT_0006958865 /DNA_START=22 /DNA_END=303 /DNA_ORIENTATION=+